MTKTEAETESETGACLLRVTGSVAETRTKAVCLQLNLSHMTCGMQQSDTFISLRSLL